MKSFSHSSVLRYLLPVFPVLLLLPACAPPRPSVPVSSPHLRSPLTVWAADHRPGSRAELDDPGFGKIDVVLEQEYRAASGLLCKRVRVKSASSCGEEVSVCREGEGEWFLAPRIWSGMEGGGK